MPANTHGGAREGAGRPDSSGRSIRLTIRVTPETSAFLAHIANKSEYIERLIQKERAKA